MPSIKYRRYGDGSDMDTFEGIPCHEVTKYLYEFYMYGINRIVRFVHTFVRYQIKKLNEACKKALYMKVHGNMSEI